MYGWKKDLTERNVSVQISPVLSHRLEPSLSLEMKRLIKILCISKDSQLRVHLSPEQ